MGARAICLGLATAVVAAAPAAADIRVTYDTSSTSPRKLERLNVTTGQREALPAAANDSAADEFHPALSPDRRRLVFLRTFQGTVRVVMVDLATGQSADLFNAFEAAADPPTTPTFSTDGRFVITGRRLEHLDPASPPDSLQPSFTKTDVSNFPSGPFSHEVVPITGLDRTTPGQTVTATPFTPSPFAFGIDFGTAAAGTIGLQQSTGSSLLGDQQTRVGNPTISGGLGVIVYERGAIRQTKLVFRSLAAPTAQPTELPRLVNATDTSVQTPEFSRNGRYLAFVRRKTTGNDGSGRLFIWDTQTQLLLDNDGVSGVNPRGPDDSMVVDTPLKPPLHIEFDGANLGVLAQDPPPVKTDAGLIVQRIEGVTEVLGKRQKKLNLIGRVRLGTLSKRLRRSRPWDRDRVGGRPLSPGHYLVTAATFTSGGDIRELGEPREITVR